jgi:hypothetical protein
MTYCFTDDSQIDEIMTDDQYDEEYLSSVWDDDQELEMYSLECCFGPEE